VNIGPIHQHRVLRMTRKVIQPGRRFYGLDFHRIRRVLEAALSGSAAGIRDLGRTYGTKRPELVAIHPAE